MEDLVFCSLLVLDVHPIPPDPADGKFYLVFCFFFFSVTPKKCQAVLVEPLAPLIPSAPSAL